MAWYVLHLYKLIIMSVIIKGLLHGYEWGLRFGGLGVEVWLKNTRVSVANEFVFCQNLNESPSNLNLHELP